MVINLLNPDNPTCVEELERLQTLGKINLNIPQIIYSPQEPEEVEDWASGGRFY